MLQRKEIETVKFASIAKAQLALKAQDIMGLQRVPQLPQRKGGTIAIDLMCDVAEDLQVSSGSKC